MNTTETITLPLCGRVQIERSRTVSGGIRLRFWELDENEKPTGEIMYITKRIAAVMPEWKRSRINFGDVEIYTDKLAAFQELYEIAKQYALALDAEFVPGSEVGGVI